MLPENNYTPYGAPGMNNQFYIQLPLPRSHPNHPSHARGARDVLRAWKADPPASPPGRPSGG